MNALVCPSVSLSDPQEYVYPDARDRQYLLFFHKGVKRTRFDVEKYNKLKDDIAEVPSLFGVLNGRCADAQDLHILGLATAVSRPAFILLFRVISLPVSSFFLPRWSWI